jgi:hypothetical protein
VLCSCGARGRGTLHMYPLGRFLTCMKAMRIGPRLLVGLPGLRGLTCCCFKGLTIVVIATAVQGVVHCKGSAMGLALLAKLLTATLLSDSTSRAPRCLVLWVTFGLGWGCTALSFCLKVCTFLLNHDLLDGL